MNVREITSFHWAKDRLGVSLSRKLMLLFLDTCPAH